MIDINSIWMAIIKGLNTEYSDYTYLKANQKGNLPEYPYVTINATIPYLKDKDMLKSKPTYINLEDPTKLQENFSEQPKMIFSFNAYSDNLAQCLKALQDTVEWLKITNKQYLENCGIVIVDIGEIKDQTNWLETDYLYHWGFDLTIRVNDIVSTQVDAVSGVKITNQNNNENLSIGDD